MFLMFGLCWVFACVFVGGPVLPLGSGLLRIVVPPLSRSRRTPHDRFRWDPHITRTSITCTSIKCRAAIRFSLPSPPYTRSRQSCGQDRALKITRVRFARTPLRLTLRFEANTLNGKSAGNSSQNRMIALGLTVTITSQANQRGRTPCPSLTNRWDPGIPTWLPDRYSCA
jgi:hypothetical protein